MTGAVIRRKELADRLKVKPNTIWRWEKAGKSPVKPTKYVRTGEVIYTEEEAKILEEWMYSTDRA
jgi:predicted site-specific integrase-resolvase